MPKDFSRTRRVGEQIQRELAVLLQREVRDPRLGQVTISAVEVTRDLSLATVYFTVLGKEQDHMAIQKALEKASGFLRHALGERMVMRSIPHLKFVYDDSISRGATLSSLIDEAVAADRKKHRDSE
ncbi:MAG: 30S ribosome-binding factor RbfA [Thiohalomonadales bacterium]|nr:30S ribosome-binding factor RbfA [Thiohalomonadales bacterium]